MGVIRGIVRVTEGLKDPNQNLFDHDQDLQIKNNLNQEILSQPIQNIENTQSDKIDKIDNIIITKNKENVLRENKVPESSLQRALQFSGLGLNLTTNALKKVLVSTFSEQKVTFKQALISEENAEILAQGLCKMRGAPLKLAQALSIQEDELIPKPIRQAFEKARESADVMPQYQLEKMLREELGLDWESKFESFDIKPFAAASIGQVHRAILKDKQVVAVKIQYPGVKQSIDSDLSNIKRVMDYTGIFPKTMFLDKLIANTRKELYEECDYLVEAEKQIRYRNNFSEYKQFAIPNVIKELSTQRILVSEYLEGDNLDQVAEHYPQYLRNSIGRMIMEVTLVELFKFRFMQSDPNPSNFYFNRKLNKLILLDFGAAHEYDKSFINDYIEIIHGAASNNRLKCLEKSKNIGFLTGEESIRMKEAHVDSIMTVGEPFRYDGEFDFGAQQLTKKIYELMPIMLKYRLRPPPQEVYSLHRKLSGAYLMNMRLQTKINCRDIFMNLYDSYK
ncbi:hypothetical protein pb186bvf_019958 [Paramecium bursaria]